MRKTPYKDSFKAFKEILRLSLLDTKKAPALTKGQVL